MELFLILFAAGALFTMLVGLIWLVSHLVARSLLNKEIRALQDRLGRVETSLSGAPSPTVAQGSGAPAASGGASPAAPSVAPPAEKAQSQSLPPAGPPVAPPPPSRSREEWEALIGGKLLNRIGAVALIFALAFFLKYAFDNDMITESVRVAIGIAIGAICLWGAALSARKGFQVFSQGLVGAGIAIQYLSVYASFNFYQLISQPVAFVLMSAVTVVAFSQAFRYNAFAVSALALVGGFCTPFLLSTGSEDMAGLFTYVALLNAGIIMVLLRHELWFGLEPLALIGTYLVFGPWFASSFQTEDRWGAVGFLVLFWVLFHALDVYRSRRENARLHEVRRLTATIHLLVFYNFLYQLLEGAATEAATVGTLILAAVLIATAVFVDGTLPLRRLHYTFAVVPGLLLVVVATGIQFHGTTRIILWSLEGVLAFWIGQQIGRKAVWLTAVLHLLFVAVSLPFVHGMFAIGSIASHIPVFNARALAFGILGGSFFVARHAAVHGITGFPRWVHDVLQGGWVAVLFSAIAVELSDGARWIAVDAGLQHQEHVAYIRSMLLAVLWILVALPLLHRGISTGSRVLFYGSVLVVSAAAAIALVQSVTYAPLAAYTIGANVRVFALAVVVVAAVILERMLARAEGGQPGTRTLRTVYRIVPVVALLVLASSEIRDAFEQRILAWASSHDPSASAVTASLENLKQMTLSGAWVVLSAGLMSVGLWQRDRLLRIQSIVIFFLAILKVFLYDLSFLETAYRIVSFLALGVILLFVSYLYQKYRSVIFGPSRTDAGAGTNPPRRG